MLEILADEAARAVAPAAVRAAFAGAAGVWKVITGKITVLPTDREAAAAKIVQLIENDPEFERELVAAMAQHQHRRADVVVPPGPPGFTDRDDVLPGLGEPGTRMVTGPPGWGKTSVVRQVSHDRARDYPDGNAYVDVDLFRTDRALRYAEVIAAVLRQVGVDVVELGDAALSTQYERALWHGRYLLVFDNVASAAEADALARNWPLSLVLLTTRDAAGELTAWCPTDPVALGGLDRAGARELLGSASRADILDAEPPATEELLDLCDSIPAFLRTAGNTLHLRRGQFKPVARLVADLRAGHDPRGFAGVLTSIGLNELPRSARDDLGLLSIHPGETFTRDSADALLGRSAGATIDTLQAAGLVVDGPGGHLRLLRLVRQRERAAPAVAEAALHRLITVVTERAVAADVTVEGDRLRPAGVPADLRWPLTHLTALEYLDLHATLIVELVQIAHHLQRYLDAIRLCGALEVVLTYLGRQHLVATAITWGIESAQELGDATATARLYATRGRIETELGLLDNAATSLDAADRAASTVVNPRLDSSVLEFRSRLARERGRRALDDGIPDPEDAFAEAAALIRRSLEIDRTHDLHRARGIHARELGNLLVRAQRPDEAMRLFEEAALHTADAQARNLSRIHLGRARAYDLLERWPDVDRELASARALAAASGAVTYAVELDDFTAETAWHRGDVETARAHWDRLAERFYAMGHPRYDRYRERLRRLPPVRQ